MKKILSSFVVMMMATVGFAQSSMLATLSHEGEISTFYGARALVEAYNAADNGDVITLSSGSFVATNIEKGLTIRGAGMAIDATTQTEPTIITGDFQINIPEEVTTRLTLEGIYHNHTITVVSTFKNGTFIKDRFKTITYSNVTITNLTMINCFVSGNLELPQNSSVSCVNCVIWEPRGYNETSNFEFSNCILGKRDWSYDVKSSSIKNCILYGWESPESWNMIPSSNTVYNSVACGTNPGSRFNDIPNTTNKVVEDMSTLFKTFTGTYSDSELYELTDEAKAAYIGLDGKEVGIYGGMMPYSSTPTNPQITKCNVASKSTADGKLSVDITVGSSDPD